MRLRVQLCLFFLLFALWAAFAFSSMLLPSPEIALALIGCSALLWMILQEVTSDKNEKNRSFESILGLLNSNKLQTVDEKISALEEATHLFLVEQAPFPNPAPSPSRAHAMLIPHVLLFAAVFFSLLALKENRGEIAPFSLSSPVQMAREVSVIPSSERASARIESVYQKDAAPLPIPPIPIEKAASTKKAISEKSTSAAASAATLRETQKKVAIKKTTAPSRRVPPPPTIEKAPALILQRETTRATAPTAEPAPESQKTEPSGFIPFKSF